MRFSLLHLLRRKKKKEFDIIDGTSWCLGNNTCEFPNTGFIEQAPTETDFIFGASPIVFESRISNGQWDAFLPSNEHQKGKLFDTMACVSFSALNSIETQLNFLINRQEISSDDLKWLKDSGYIDESGRLNFADRFTAKMSGTTKNGNHLVKVADSLRNDGAVPEKDWGWNKDVFNWEEFYAEIPESVKQKGKEFAKRFEIGYEWVPNSLEAIKQNLQHAPLQIASRTCPGWSSGTIIASCIGTANHATLIYGYEEGSAIKDYDHYEPFQKKLAWNYAIPWVLKIIVKSIKILNQQKTMSGFQLKGSPEVYVQVGHKYLWVNSWDAYVALGGSQEKIVLLDPAEYAKLPIDNTTVLTKR